MQKTAAAKLIPSETQAQALKATLAVFADACNQAVKVAQENNVKRAFDIHRLCYHQIKTATGLTSNYVVRAIGRVAVVFVEPAYTSKTCSVCGEIGSRRKHKFVCKSCGIVLDADINGAVNISRRGRQSLRSRHGSQPARSGGTRYRPASRRLIGDGS